jgi:hypothetical protein
MLKRRAKASGDEQGAEFIAVQSDGVRFVIDPGSADVGGGRVLKEIFLRWRTCITRRWCTTAL